MGDGIKILANSLGANVNYLGGVNGGNKINMSQELCPEQRGQGTNGGLSYQ